MNEEFEPCPQCGHLICPPMRHVCSSELRRAPLDTLNAEVDGNARLRLWIAENPYVPDSLRDFIVPKHGHIIEVDGMPFDSLADAEEYARVGPDVDRPLTIYCYTANQKKAASQ
jgi:hypothetical protein